MKNKLLVILFFLSTSLDCVFAESTLSDSDKKDPYPNDVKYNQVCWLTSHNAFAFSMAGLYVQQNWDFDQQFEYGVRSFMVDFHWYKPLELPGSLFQRPPYIALCHEPDNTLESKHCTVTFFTLPGAPDPALSFLEKVKSWLDNNPKEIITLHIESYIAGSLEGLFEKAGLIKSEEIKDSKNYLYKATDGSQTETNWPTLGDIRKSGRRLIVFSDRKDNKMLYVDSYQETAYDLKSYPGCEMREDNKRSLAKDLFLLNHFYSFAVASVLGDPLKLYENVNRYDKIRARVEMCSEQRNRMPNFIAVDFVQKGDAKQLVSDINSGKLDAKTKTHRDEL